MLLEALIQAYINMHRSNVSLGKTHFCIAVNQSPYPIVEAVYCFSKYASHWGQVVRVWYYQNNTTMVSDDILYEQLLENTGQGKCDCVKFYIYNLQLCLWEEACGRASRIHRNLLGWR